MVGLTTVVSLPQLPQRRSASVTALFQADYGGQTDHRLKCRFQRCGWGNSKLLKVSRIGI